MRTAGRSSVPEDRGDKGFKWRAPGRPSPGDWRASGYFLPKEHRSGGHTEISYPYGVGRIRTAVKASQTLSDRPGYPTTPRPVQIVPWPLKIPVVTQFLKKSYRLNGIAPDHGRSKNESVFASALLPGVGWQERFRSVVKSLIRRGGVPPGAAAFVVHREKAAISSRSREQSGFQKKNL